MSKKITEELLLRAKGGSREAAGEICELMKGQIKSIAIRLGKQYPALDLDDAIQTGYLAVLKAINRYDMDRGQANFGSYAYQAAENRIKIAIKAMLRRGRRESVVPNEDMDSPRHDEHRLANYLDPDSIRRLSLIEARTLIARLGPIIEGKSPRSWREVAKLLKSDVAASKSIFESAVAKLRQENE